MKTLLGKLGYKPGAVARVSGAPASLCEALAGVTAGADPTFLLAFVRNRAELAEAVSAITPAYHPGGHLWFAYPKKSGAIRSDISRDEGWGPLSERGFLVVTQVALDPDWSALRFRLREEIKVLRRKSEQA